MAKKSKKCPDMRSSDAPWLADPADPAYRKLKVNRENTIKYLTIYRTTGTMKLVNKLLKKGQGIWYALKQKKFW